MKKLMQGEVTIKDATSPKTTDVKSKSESGKSGSTTQTGKRLTDRAVKPRQAG